MTTLLDPILLLIFIMLVCGIIGGIANYFQLPKVEAPAESMSWKRHAFGGVVAAFLVPLFLSTTKSPLVTDILAAKSANPDFSGLLLFVGYCLVAAVSARAFISTMSNRVLQAAKQATEIATQAKSEAEKASKESAKAVQDATSAKVDAARGKDDAAMAKAAVEIFVEPDEVEVPAGTQKSVSMEMSESLAPDELSVMKAMVDSGFALRSMNGIAKQTSIDSARIKAILSDLIDKAYVAQGENSKGAPRWYLTTDGRVFLARHQ